MLTLDIYREIFRYLEPREYRSLSLTCKLCLEASKRSFQPSLIYKGNIKEHHWLLKISRLGEAEAFVCSSEEVKEEQLEEGVFKISVPRHLFGSGENHDFVSCKLDRGRFNGDLIYKALQRSAANPGNYIYNVYTRATLVSGKLEGEIERHIGGVVGRIRFKNGHNGAYSLVLCNALKYLNGELVIIDNITISQSMGKDVIFTYLPATLSDKIIPVKKHNLDEIILPLDLTNCLDSLTIAKKVGFTIHRCIIYIIQILRESF